MSLQQKLRAFAQLDLGGIIPWESFQFPDASNSDISRCVIEGRAGTYRLEVTSSYSAPPLGRVLFTDGDFEIVEANQDIAWHKIAERLKIREGGKAVAAEPTPVAAPAVVVPITHNPLAIPDRTLVYYWAEAGAWYQNGPAMVTRRNRDGSYNLVVFPENSEPVHRERIEQKSDNLQYVCWEAYPQERGVDPLAESQIALLAARVEQLSAQVAELAAKRGPGRPANPVKVA